MTQADPRCPVCNLGSVEVTVHGDAARQYLCFKGHRFQEVDMQELGMEFAGLEAVGGETVEGAD